MSEFTLAQRRFWALNTTMESNLSLREKFIRDSRIWLRGAISDAELLCFDEAVTFKSKAGQRVEAGDGLSLALSEDSSLMGAVKRLDPDAKPVRVVAFNKSKDTNWGVPWHQDRVIAVAARHDVQGFGNWTKKSHAWHCEPPQNLLHQMLFVRVHLDDTDSNNGAMQISVGSHAKGLVSTADAESVAKTFPIESCDAKRGDVLILNMLTLHCSKPSNAQSDRRVFRIDFAPFDLPAPLSWV